MLQASVSTNQRRRREFGLSDEVERYSDITDDELGQIYASVTVTRVKAPLPLMWVVGVPYNALGRDVCVPYTRSLYLCFQICRHSA